MQGTTKIVALFVAAALVAAALAACGSSGSDSSTSGQALSQKQYRAFLAGIAKREAKAQAKIQQGLQAKAPQSIAAALEGFDATEEDVAGELDGVSPPSNAAAANSALAKAFHDGAAAGDKVAVEVAEAKSVEQAVAVLQSAKGPQESGREIDAALGRLQKLGYTSGS